MGFVLHGQWDIGLLWRMHRVELDMILSEQPPLVDREGLDI